MAEQGPAPRRALVVVDVQQQYFEGVLEIRHPAPEQALARVVRAIEVALEHDLPVVLVRHEYPEGAPVFAVGSPGWEVRPEVESLAREEWLRVSKSRASVFAGTGVASWLEEQGVDTITVVGFMTNNCDLATAIGAEELGLAAEVLSDATGAIHLAHEQGQVAAAQLHDTLMVLLHSNFAAVATTDAWAAAVASGEPLPKSSLGAAATRGHEVFDA